MSFCCGGGGGVVNRKDPGSLLIYANVDSQVAICKLAASQPTLQLTIPERFQQKATKHIEMCPSVHPRTKVVKKVHERIILVKPLYAKEICSLVEKNLLTKTQGIYIRIYMYMFSIFL